MQRASLTGSNAGRLAPPAPLFAVAILPGAAAAVSIACPSPSSPGPGLPAGRRGPGAAVYLHVPAVAALLACASGRIPKHIGKITNRALAPKKKKKKKPCTREEAGPVGRDGRGLSGAGSCARAFASLRRLWSRRRGPEEAGKLHCLGLRLPSASDFRCGTR